MATETRPQSYDAKTAYQRYESAERYEKRDFYKGFLGRFRKRAEQAAIGGLTAFVPQGSEFLDCPCGNGRWFETLARRARKITGMDVSEGMIQFARERAASLSFEVEVRRGDAENIDLEDGAVDFTFSYALMKHLPVPVQYRVLAEFGRVSRQGVICSFGLLRPLSYMIWRRRKIEESYPVFEEEIGWMAADAGLEIREIRRCSTPLGLEHLVLFGKKG